MKVVVELDIELIKGTDHQLFQDLFDSLNKLEWFGRDKDGEVYLHYIVNVEMMVPNESPVLLPGDMREHPTEG